MFQEEDHAYHDEEISVDFLQSMVMQDIDQLDEAYPTRKHKGEEEIQYNSNKPKWWKKQCSNPTRAQKRSIQSMQKFRVPTMKWGQVLDWSEIFPQLQQSTSSSCEQQQQNQGQKQPRDEDIPEIWLEMGFGNGDNLLALAHRHPNRYYVGAEIHIPGIGKLCQRIQEGLESNSYWTDYVLFSKERSNQPSNQHQVDNSNKIMKQSQEATTEERHEESITPNDPTIQSANDNLYSNLRFHGGDGVKFLPNIETSTLSVVLVTFPDPFPKEREISNRILQKATLQQIHRVLRHSGRLYLATDHFDFWNWCLQMVDRVNQDCPSADLFVPVDVPERLEWLPAVSKYEQKGWDEGRTTHLNCWQVLKK